MLTDLLSHAIEDVTIESDRQHSPLITVQQYRSWTLTRTKSRRLELDSALRGITPRLPVGKVRQELTDEVLKLLSSLSNDGRVLLGVHEMLGGLVGPIGVEHIVDKLVQLSVVYGADWASQAFLDSIANLECRYQTYALLLGISIEGVIEAFDGIRLLPLPRSTAELPAFIPEISGFSGISDLHLLGAVVLEVDHYLYPRFALPETDIGRSFETGEFRDKVRSSDLDSLSLDTFCRALSLATGRTVRNAVTWRHVPFQEVGQKIDRSEGSQSIRLGRHPETWRIGADTGDIVSNLRSLYLKMSNGDRPLAERLETPIERWMESGVEKSLADRVIDLGIALESLYVDDGGDSISYRLSVRAARHLRNDLESRKKVKWQMTRAYRLRSGVAHRNIVSSKGMTYKGRQYSAEELVGEARDLCREGIIRALEEGVPDRDELVLE